MTEGNNDHSGAVACIARGNEAFVYDDYTEAVACYTEALQIDPSNAQALVLRSHAHNKLGHHLEASQDATKAIKLDPSARSAHLRKGYVQPCYVCSAAITARPSNSIANFYLEEYETALEALQVALKQHPDAAVWIAKCQAELAEEAGADSASQHANGIPTSNPSGVPCAPEPPGAQQRLDDIPIAPCVVPAREAYRLEWFQTADAVEVAVLAKGLSAEQVSVDICPDTLCVRITNVDGADEHCLSLQLFAGVDPAASRWTLLRTKVEIMLKKESAVHWASLDAAGTRGGVAAAAAALPTPMAAESAAAKPHYPSSSRRKVDWDTIDHQIQEELKDEPDGDPLQGLFQQIYAGADEDTRRAMNKSFQESGGTVLSTNWKEVGTKKVEYVPPASDS